jgi:tRNA (cytidine/uridine-2'-O-)-methyltransferase
MTTCLLHHHLNLALMHPQIAPNTGNVARSCVATGTHLHLVRPFGFVLSDKNLRRSAMDYWDRLKLTIHDDDELFFRAVEQSGGNFWLFTSKAKRTMWEARFAEGGWLIFGSETAGIPEDFVARNSDRAVRIPQISGERCLNLSTAAGIALYEALRQIQRPVVE